MPKTRGCPCQCITVTPPLPFPNGKSPWNEVGATRRVESADSSYYFKRWFLPNIRIQDVRNSAIQKQLIFSSPQSKEIMGLCNTLLKHYSWSRPKTRHDFLQKDTSLRQQIINFITVLIGSYFQKREQAPVKTYFTCKQYSDHRFCSRASRRC